MVAPSGGGDRSQRTRQSTTSATSCPPGTRSHTALLWLRNSYATYQDYDLDVVGISTSDAVE